MNDDFVETLALQLRSAAEREQRRRAPARRWAAARTALPHLALAPATAVVAVAAILAVAVFAVIAARREPEAPVAPEVVARFTPATSLGSIAAGFGSAWLDDPDADQVLRIDAATRRVTARLPVTGDVSIDSGSGSVWAIGSSLSARGLQTTGPLLRIDPRTNRVVGRVPLPIPANLQSHSALVVATPAAIWVIGPYVAVLVDARTNHVVKRIAVPATFDATGGATLQGKDLWMLRDDGTLLRFDARTGARLGVLRTSTRGELFDVGGALIAVGNHAVTRLDPATGQALWRHPVAFDSPAAVASGRLWVETADPGRAGDRLVAYEPRTGRVTTSVHVGEFSPAGLERVGSELWMITPGGRVVVVGPVHAP
jgi:outer membrane protein assembly factor BamB